jgi:SsrA-binding protein
MKNRKATFDYEIGDRYTAGMMLTSSEVKSLRDGNMSFTDSYIMIKDGELYVTGIYIAKYLPASYNNHEEKRPRKLLLKKKEINEIIRYLTDNGTVAIPLSITMSNGKFKLNIGLGRGKKSRDKRQTIKDRDLKREMSRKEQ